MRSQEGQRGGLLQNELVSGKSSNDYLGAVRVRKASGGSWKSAQLQCLSHGKLFCYYGVIIDEKRLRLLTRVGFCIVVLGFTIATANPTNVLSTCHQLRTRPRHFNSKSWWLISSRTSRIVYFLEHK